MKPTDILSSEHRIIEQVLECLERIIDQAAADNRLDAAAASDALDFLRNFADRCHHGKEETHLFPAMEARGYPADHGPTAVMRTEHDQGRAHLRAMADAILPASAGDAAALRSFAHHGRGYLDLLRQHIEKEDHCLFPMADGVLDEADQAALLARFDHVEAHDMGPGTHQRYLELADALARRYGVTPVAKKQGCGCSCGH